MFQIVSVSQLLSTAYPVNQVTRLCLSSDILFTRSLISGTLRVGTGQACLSILKTADLL